jgi:hypothetical protein
MTGLDKEMSFYRRIQNLWEEKPLVVILFLAVIFRLAAVIFAKGWGMLDDHFLVIETAQSWVDGEDSDAWLPGSPTNSGPTGHNFFYPGLHFLLFSLFRMIHFDDPQMKMVIVRLLHASWSMITVYFGYKIALKLGGDKAARMAGLFLAIYWFMPWASVRNLVEVFCIPFLILAVWRLIRKPETELRSVDFLVAGIMLGFAFNIRVQTVFFSIGFGLAYLFKGRWKEVIILTAGAIIPFILIQGTIDYFMWGRPFAEVDGYIRGNIIHATGYINQPWYNYFLVILGFLLPPVSLFLFYGYLRCWKKHLILFLPVALFFIFHSLFPNKQERFIFPALPFIMIAGSIGWYNFVEGSKFWKSRMRLLKACWIFFWVLNLVALFAISFVYSKRARVETMTYLSKYREIKSFMVADEGNNPEIFPCFYLGQWPIIYGEFLEGENTDSVIIRASKAPLAKQPRFVLFTAENDLSQMVIKVRRRFPFIVYETTIEPGFIDKFVRWLNPVNKNRTLYIYRNTLFYPDKIK